MLRASIVSLLILASIATLAHSENKEKEKKRKARREAAAAAESETKTPDIVWLSDTGLATDHASTVGGTESEVRASLGVFDRIEAKSIVLRDDEGRSRANLGIDGGNVLRFSAGSDDYSQTFMLSVFPDGRAALILRDDRGRNRLTLSVREDGRPVLSLSEDANVILHDDRGRNRAVLSVPNDGQPRLSLYNERSQPTTIAPQE